MINWIEKHLIKILLVIIVIQLWVAIGYLSEIKSFTSGLYYNAIN